MMPKSIMNRALTKADELLTEKTGQNVFILVANQDFQKAKAAAEQLYDAIKDSDAFKSITLHTDTGSFDDAVDFVSINKYNLLNTSRTHQILGGGAQDFADSSIDKAFSSFDIVALDTDSDPFLLASVEVSDYLQKIADAAPALSMKDGVMARHSVEKDLWYVMVRVVLSPKGAALASKTNGVSQIYAAARPLEVDGTRFVYSGTAVHSNTSSSNAVKEIGIIGAISLFVVVAILLAVFGTPAPILLSVGAIFVSCFTAFCATVAIFGKLHILTLVFGTSLIGSCIDYSLHYFINWKANTALSSTDAIRTFLFKGLSLSLASTVLCYFVLLFAPFGLLRQMSVFSISGITSSFLTVICLYPLVPLPKSRTIRVLGVHLPRYNKKVVGRAVITGVFAAAILTIIIFHKNFALHNDIKNLYKLEGRELSDELEAAAILSYNPSGWFIVSGATVEDMLQTEESLVAILKESGSARVMATTSFVPSVAQQRLSQKAVATLVPLLQSQYAALGYDEAESQDLCTAVEQEFASFQRAQDFIDLENLPDALAQVLSQSYLGKVDGKYYSVVMPVSVNKESIASFPQIAQKVPGVFFMNKVGSMNDDLDKLSHMILRAFVVVYLLLAVLLKFFYSAKQTAKIISVPLLIILSIIAGFSATSTYLEFFSITGMILVFGLGLDYVIYMLENEKRAQANLGGYSPLESFAIFLSFITTVVSFGSLSFSNFKPVHNIALAIFIGLTVSYVSTFFYSRVSAAESQE